MPLTDIDLTESSHLENIDRCSLPAHLTEVIDAYEAVGGERDRFLWQWLYYVFPTIELSCVEPDASQQVREVKFLASMYVVVLDDLAEAAKDQRTFQEASKIPFDHLEPDIDDPAVDADRVAFAVAVWERVMATLESAPRGSTFEDVFLFDIAQTHTAIEYSALVNRHLELATVESITAYDSYNMMLFTYADIDLCFGPAFDRNEIGSLRRITRRAQMMARIGNWVTTWERELREGDYSSGVVIAALEDGVVSREQVRACGDDAETTEACIDAIADAGIESRFLHQWDTHYQEIKRLAPALESVDVDALLGGLETLLECHLVSRGHK
ncbi:hypothetical protein [Natronosalvus vescus]|uniref:hypothetical protein n=1 Tax=Natronosalvus vescus TaxID=2953881 RepID=UPI002090AB8F|nr:hypothetical protein [Natronosalvus vescus]